MCGGISLNTDLTATTSVAVVLVSVLDDTGVVLNDKKCSVFAPTPHIPNQEYMNTSFSAEIKTKRFGFGSCLLRGELMIDKEIINQICCY